ncbi:hypothetical protein [Priestia megaterium]|uniref:hypothetical protein n=1 Tax=Priestia megaterium TaxID=1404 RepID=UPI001D63C57D|nr:hypothetical protein [Priestia megaterium]CAH0306266.1 hypothetical protein SRABI82_04742 [Priestia megaterium]
MSQFKFGMDAIEESNGAGGNGGPKSDFAKLPPGVPLKVKLTGLDNVMRYFGYGVFKRVNTFIAANPSTRNANGFVESDHTPWDLASKYYYDKASELLKGVDKDDKEAVKAVKDTKEYKNLASEGYKYSGKKRYAVGFVDLETGKQIVLDFTSKQFEEGLKDKLKKYDAKKDKVAFEIEKVGEGTKTTISLAPVIDMEEDMTEKEQANFEKSIGKEFDKANFEGLLFEADEKTQTENLVAAGFDITLIGLSIGGNTGGNDSDFANGNEAKTEEYDF